ncbi:hypothetical protein D3C79_883220 [compost metagenome]
MAAVLVVLAPEQRGRLVEQCGLQRRQPLWKPIHLLVDIGHTQVTDAARPEFMLIPPTAHLVVGLQIGAAAHVLGQAWPKAESIAQHVVTLLQV